MDKLSKTFVTAITNGCFRPKNGNFGFIRQRDLKCMPADILPIREYKFGKWC